MSKALKIGLIGFGNIGTGVVRGLEQMRDLHASRLPRALELAAIADRDTTSPRNAPYNPSILTNDAAELFANPEIDVIIELVGGEEPARTFIEKALRAGKHVVTANKAVMAVYGPELLAIAEENGVGLLFEAAVAGGIPIIRTLEQGLCANEMTSVQGILNGTCNYILTRMTEEGLAFDGVLADAQKLGYAEPDPTYDIEGYDTAHKTAILASLAFGMDIRFSDVHVEGITQIAPVDIKYAQELGYAIKLLGIAKRDEPGGPVEVRVHPTLVPLESPIGSVNGVFNAVLTDGKPIGPTMYYGRGAGADATSSAVISDLMALAADADGYNRWRDSKLGVKVGQKQIKPMAELVSNYYLRFEMTDQRGVMAAIGLALANHNVSIESMIQHKGEDEDDGLATITIVTHETREADVQAAIEEIEAQEICRSKTFVLRVEE